MRFSLRSDNCFVFKSSATTQSGFPGISGLDGPLVGYSESNARSNFPQFTSVPNQWYYGATITFRGIARAGFGDSPRGGQDAQRLGNRRLYHFIRGSRLVGHRFTAAPSTHSNRGWRDEAIGPFETGRTRKGSDGYRREATQFRAGSAPLVRREHFGVELGGVSIDHPRVWPGPRRKAHRLMRSTVFR